MKVWIDTKTGTWGQLDQGLVIVDLAECVWQDGETVQTYLDFLDEASDAEIRSFGILEGESVKR